MKAMKTALFAALVACKAKGGIDEKSVAVAEQDSTRAAGSGSAGGAGAVVSKAPAALHRRDEAQKEDLKVNLPKGQAQEIDQPAKTEAFADVDAKKLDKGAHEHAKVPEGVTRAWFPETFLWEPRVVTDDTGAATVPVRVPDRLTTWRVLALAHTRQGAQAGATTSFLGTLPTYVDPVVPKRLVIGDSVRLPIQLVNTTTAPVAAKLEIEAKRATVTGGGGARTIPAQGNLVDYVTLDAKAAGTAQLRVGLGATDAVLRDIEVVPAGKPIVTTRSGTLAAPRTALLEGPARSDPATDRVRLLAFPGALALLRAELGVSTAREGLADDAYALLLAGRATNLLAALGDKPDPAALRDLAILTTQRAVRDGRTLDVDSATLLAAPALSHGQNPVLSRLGARAVELLAQQQRPDGTFAGGTGWTLQRVLVATAEATRAVAASNATVADKQRATGVAMRAAGAFERNLAHVEDGYTAAAILASGAVKGPIADALRKRVEGAIKTTEDGARYLDVPDGVVRADGRIPSRAEATALAALALPDDPKRADLGATLLSTYSLERGWGDGRANLVCMQAVIELFKTPVPSDVKITLTMDGKPLVEGSLNRERLRDVLTLSAPAPGLAGKHTYAITADPPVAGLGYSLSLDSWVPWDKEPVHGGLELALPASINGTVGKPTEIAMTAVAPSGIELHIQHALPAGVQVDRPSLEALVNMKAITRFETADGKVDLYIAPLEPGQTFAARYRVIPTLAGRLHATASTIEAGKYVFHVPPVEWTIR
jgi:hypothetical protein